MTESNNTPVQVLEWLRREPVRYGLVLNDLANFPQTSTFQARGGASSHDFGFLHRSGHPAMQAISAFVLGGDHTTASSLLRERLPKQPFVIRETSWSFATLIQEIFPESLIYKQIQLVVDSKSANISHSENARILTIDDIDHVADFTNTPPAVKTRLIGWLRGATVVGVFSDKVLASMGSTLFSLPEVCALVSINTRSEFRGRGYGRQVTSKLIRLSLEKSGVVVLTVRSDNKAAIRMYRSLGFSVREQRVWASVGHDGEP